MLHTKYQSSAPSSFREEFWSFPCLFLCFELVTLGIRPVLTLGASYEHNLCRGPLGHITNKYQTYAASSFRKEEFWSFPSLFLCFKLVTLRARPVLTQGASYEQSWYKSTRRCFISNIKALHFLVSEKKNFKVFLLCSYVSNLWSLHTPPHTPHTPVRGQFWLQGHHMNNLGRGPLGDATYEISKLCTF